MTQKLGIGSLFGSGIVGVLFVAGIAMWLLNIPFGAPVIFIAIIVAVILAVLGIVGTSRRVGLF